MADATHPGARELPRARLARSITVHAITGLGLLAGLAAVAVSSDPRFAAGWILLASCFDALDGRLARRWGVASKFGARLDAFADAFSFGIAPAACVALGADWGRGGLVAGLVFGLAISWRLARGRCDDRGFDGLPAPAAAWCAIGATASVEPIGLALVLAAAVSANATRWRYPRLEALPRPVSSLLPGLLAVALVTWFAGAPIRVLLLVLGLVYATWPAVGALRGGRA